MALVLTCEKFQLVIFTGSVFFKSIQKPLNLDLVCAGVVEATWSATQKYAQSIRHSFVLTGAKFHLATLTGSIFSKNIQKALKSFMRTLWKQYI